MAMFTLEEMDDERRQPDPVIIDADQDVVPQPVGLARIVCSSEARMAHVAVKTVPSFLFLTGQPVDASSLLW